MLGTNTYMAAVGLQHHDGPIRRQVMLLNETEQKCDESCNLNDQGRKYDFENHSDKENVNVNLKDEIELYNVISANNVIFALDFIREIRRILHCRQTTTLTSVGSSHNSQSTQFVLRVG